MDDITREFLAESQEGLDAFDRHMVELEGDPANTALLTKIFRIVHTIKGTCGFLGFGRLETLTHTGENLLARLRDGVVTTTPSVATALLALGDGMRNILSHIDRTASEPDTDYSALIATLEALAAATRAPTVEAAAAPPIPATTRPLADNTALFEAPVAAPETPEAIPEARPVAPAPITAPEGAPRVQAETPVDAPKAETSVRVDVEVLDKLMNLVGEMVLTRNQILQLTHNLNQPQLVQACQRLNLLTTELQEGVMKTRMQPIGQLWNRFPRLIRDVAMACRKQVRLEMSGKDTELDRAILESIRDPMIHILRNAIDHGVETPEARVAAGKPAEGVITLRAWHEGGLVHIDIADDGGGIDPTRVFAKAVERGLVSPDARMSKANILNLIFQPGFSTAAQVTAISGRGVGMDVVKSNVEKIGGVVEITSNLGTGSRFRISIPLTLAIIPVLIVSAAGCRYAIPQVNLVELVRLDPTGGPSGIEQVEGCRVYRLRGQLLPVIDLAETLTGSADPGRGRVNLVVVRAGGRMFGIQVGAVCDTEEIVVKPIDRFVQGLPCYAGVTILGDGAVALILDAGGLARMAALEIAEKETPVAANDTRAFVDATNNAVLLLGLGADRRIAIPLGEVARIDEIAATAIEYADGSPVLQYRGELLPLISLTERFGDSSLGASTRIPVVVHKRAGVSVGLLAERILDVVNDVPQPRPSGRLRRGIRGSVVVRERVTDIVDMDALAEEIQLRDSATEVA